MEYEPTIGLEIHVELKTKTKMFCNSANDPDEKHPNLNVCPICMGHPGTLPTINKEAVNKLISVGLALNCHAAEFSKFDRKNYFYPDLPKGYQISQYDLPLCKDGYLEIDGRKIRIERIHIEEDTGRLLHPDGANYSLVDFNRAGIPLMELVTMPDLKSGKEIEGFAKELRLILRYLDASDADMEKGQMRVEVNVSVKKKGAEKLGTKVELKNINSIKAASAATDYEIKRQTELIDSGREVKQETRGWDETKQVTSSLSRPSSISAPRASNTAVPKQYETYEFSSESVVGATFSQRIKEGSADYRYFPEPDLPPMRFAKDEIEEIKLGLPELPAGHRVRFKNQYSLTDAQIEIFTLAKNLGNYFENVVSELDSWDNFKHIKRPDPTHQQKLYTLAANYLITEFPPLFGMSGMEIDDIEGIKITPPAFGDLVTRIFHQELSSTGAKAVLKEMFETGLTPGEIIKSRDLGQISETGELEKLVEKAIAKNPKAVEDYKKGKAESIKFLVGQIMKETKGRANPEIINKFLLSRLENK